MVKNDGLFKKKKKKRNAGLWSMRLVEIQELFGHKINNAHNHKLYRLILLIFISNKHSCRFLPAVRILIYIIHKNYL
jgi:hypothetical protein